MIVPVFINFSPLPCKLSMPPAGPLTITSKTLPTSNLLGILQSFWIDVYNRTSHLNLRWCPTKVESFFFFSRCSPRWTFLSFKTISIFYMCYLVLIKFCIAVSCGHSSVFCPRFSWYLSQTKLFVLRIWFASLNYGAFL